MGSDGTEFAAIAETTCFLHYGLCRGAGRAARAHSDGAATRARKDTALDRGGDGR